MTAAVSALALPVTGSGVPRATPSRRAVFIRKQIASHECAVGRVLKASRALSLGSRSTWRRTAAVVRSTSPWRAGREGT
jgi:hypothetical protein